MEQLKKKIELTPDICCDQCDQMICIRMACPACHHSCAQTNLRDYPGAGEVIECKSCGQKFRTLRMDDYCNWIVERIK